jgi:hypothetical protein
MSASGPITRLRGLVRIATGKAMTMNATAKLRFAKSGLYRFKTVTSEMSGMPDMKTIGPDYGLRLTVRVT